MNLKNLYTVSEAAILISKVTGEHQLHVAESIVEKIKPSISYSPQGHRKESLKIDSYDIYGRKRDGWPSYALYKFNQTAPDEPYHFFNHAPYNLCLFNLVTLLNVVGYHPEFQKKILASRRRSPIEAQKPAGDSPPPHPTEAATTGARTSTSKWSVIKPQRFRGYSTPLFHFLNAAHARGESRPTARDVLEAWRKEKPAEITSLMPDGFKYLNDIGNTKAVDLEALRKTIARMTSIP